MRDYDDNPYSPDEERVAKWLSDHGLGGGEDPIGFLLISYDCINKQLKDAKIIGQLMNL
jgi:hypothetical protein